MSYMIPKFYGIQEIDYIYHGDWSDPEVRYKNQLFDYYELENALYELFNDDKKAKEFKDWVSENKDKVFEILDDLSKNIVKEYDEEICNL